MGLADLLDDYTKDNDLSGLNKLVSDMVRGGARFKHVPFFNVPSEFSSVYTDLKFNPLYMNINPSDPIITSHELGHLSDFTKSKLNRFLYSTFHEKPVLHHIGTLLKERNANKESWEALSKAYKDQPEILKAFKDLRTEALVPAYKTYLVNHGIPLAGVAGGGAIGALLGRGLTSLYIDDDEDFGPLDTESKKKVKRRRREATRNLGTGVGAVGGAIIGNSIASDYAKKKLPEVYKKFKNVLDSSTYKDAIADLLSKLKKK